MTCPQCNEGKLDKTSIYRYEPIIVAAGVALSIASVVFVLLGVKFSLAEGGGLRAPVVLGVGPGCLLVGLFGLISSQFMLRRRTVWKCNSCGHLEEASDSSPKVPE